MNIYIYILFYYYTIYCTYRIIYYVKCIRVDLCQYLLMILNALLIFWIQLHIDTDIRLDKDICHSPKVSGRENGRNTFSRGIPVHSKDSAEIMVMECSNGRFQSFICPCTLPSINISPVAKWKIIFQTLEVVG